LQYFVQLLLMLDSIAQVRGHGTAQVRARVVGLGSGSAGVFQPGFQDRPLLAPAIAPGRGETECT
jgi:hypothetical protein